MFYALGGRYSNAPQIRVLEQIAAVTQSVVHLVAAARPNFMKVAPLYHALTRESWCKPVIVHTGQHYDASMSAAFFQDLQLPSPEYNLGVGSGTHAEQTGRTMIAYETVCSAAAPTVIVVVGDVNATVACALVGAKLCIPVVHLEAGLRSRDRTMPEEINRVVTDSIANLLWTPSADADENLMSEGVPQSRIERIGNIMIDSFEMLRDRIETVRIEKYLDRNVGPYAVVTLHRPSNVDDRDRLVELVGVIERLAEEMRIAFVIHPRTRKRLREFDLEERVLKHRHIHAIEPLGYVEFMALVCGCATAITDSGGIQEETTYLGIPCITLRDNTERPVTVTSGTNRLARSSADILALGRRAVSGQWPKGFRPEYWDGHTAARAVQSLRQFLEVP